MSFIISHPDVEGTAVIAERALPLYAAKDWLLEGRVDDDAAPASALHLEQPSRSDSSAQWKTYAVAVGMDFDKAMSMTRDELAEHYNPTPPDEPKPTPKAPMKSGTPAPTTTQES